MAFLFCQEGQEFPPWLSMPVWVCVCVRYASYCVFIPSRETEKVVFSLSNSNGKITLTGRQAGRQAADQLPSPDRWTLTCCECPFPSSLSSASSSSSSLRPWVFQALWLSRLMSTFLVLCPNWMARPPPFLGVHPPPPCHFGRPAQSGKHRITPSNLL